MTFATCLTYCLTCIALAMAPGPTVTIIVAASMRLGTKAGIAIAAGTIAGMLVWLAAAAGGLSFISAKESPVFTGLRFAGSAYVIWLGVKLLQTGGQLKAGNSDIAGFWPLAIQGFAVILTNPKMFVLYGVIIPPLLAGFASAGKGTLMLGGTFVVIATVCDVLYALIGGRAGGWLMQRSNLRIIEVVSAVFLISAGLWLALR